MNPLGIAMAFVMLWSIVGLGLFLIATAAVRLTRKASPVGVVAQAVMVSDARARAQRIISVVMLAAGAVLTLVGGNGIYTVIYK